MKKIIACAFALVITFTLVSCGSSGHSELEPFIEAMNVYSFSGAEITASLSSELGELTANYDITYNDDGSASVVYSKKVFNSIAPDSTADSLISNVSGVASVDKNANVTSGELGRLVAVMTMLLPELDGDRLEYSVEDGVLTASISAEDTEDVLLVNTGYDTLVTVRLTGDSVDTVTVSYTSGDGPVFVNCCYN